MLAHVDMDAFYAAVEALDRPWLKGRPVIVGGGRRGVVSAASYEARAFGVRSAMPIYQARRLCPQGEFLPVRMGRYRQMSAMVMAALGSFTPLVEPVSVDEAYLDLAGTERLWGPPRATGLAIKAAVAEATGLTCSVGLAPVRFLAKIASDRDKPDGLTVVEDVEAFLATITLAQVPGVGQRALERLKALGLTRLVELRVLGQERLERIMGSFGRRLWELAHGVDPQGVSLGREAKSVGHELTFEQDIADRRVLASHLLALCQRTAARLRGHGLCGRTVTLKLKHGDFRQATRRVTLPRPTDHAPEIYQAAQALLAAYASPGPLRLIGVAVGGLAPRQDSQAGLFDQDREGRLRALDQAEDAVRQRFGSRALVRAGALPALGGGQDEGLGEKG